MSSFQPTRPGTVCQAFSGQISLVHIFSTCYPGRNGMPKALHQHQKDLLVLIRRKRGDLTNMSLRDMGDAIGVHDRAQVVAHHLDQLEKKGLIRRVQAGVKKFEISEQPTEQIVYVDLYRATAQCGPDGFLGDDAILERVPLASKTFGISNADNFFLIKARGDSMVPMIDENDLVLARKQDDVESGQIAVVVHDGMPKIKKILKKTNGDGSVFYALVSLNGRYGEEEIVDDSSGFKVCGLVKGVLKVR